MTVTTLRYYKGASAGEWRADPLPNGPRILIRRTDTHRGFWTAYVSKHGLDVDNLEPDKLEVYGSLREARIACHREWQAWKREAREALAAFARGEAELR